MADRRGFVGAQMMRRSVCVTKDPSRKKNKRVRIELEPDAAEQFARAIADMKVDPHQKDRDEPPPAKNRETRSGPVVIDLHGHTVDEAKAEVDREIGRLSLVRGQRVHVRIITGKGRHSQGEGVLPRAIHDYVSQRFARIIDKIDESPADLVLGELPMRGHFDVWLKQK